MRMVVVATPLAYQDAYRSSTALPVGSWGISLEDSSRAILGLVIEVRAVSKRFVSRSRTTDVLDRIDLTVNDGEFVSIIGPSGCGKSTLLRVVAGLLEPDDGSVTIDGRTSSSARNEKLIAFAPQAPALLPWKNVRDNARLLARVNQTANAGRVADRDEIDELLVKVGLGDFLDALPYELSGGMQQRVGLVRAFALHASVVLMDEPFAALDELVRTEMRYLLLSLWERNRSSVVFVTHSLAEAVTLSDRVVVMSPRPGQFVYDHNVALPRPRVAQQEDDIEFFEQVRTVRHALTSAVAS
jgi:NitT/TauT family transport system ATP-binding protein